MDEKISNLESNLSTVGEGIAKLNQKVLKTQHAKRLAERISNVEKYIKKEDEAVKAQESYYGAVQADKTLSEQVRSLNNNLIGIRNKISLMEDVASLKTSGNLRCLNVGEDGYCKAIYRTANNAREPNLKPVTFEGKTIYRSNVQKHPIICLGCPRYEQQPIDNIKKS